MCRGVACPVHQASLSFLGCLWPCADRIPMPSPLALLGKPAKPCWQRGSLTLARARAGYEQERERRATRWSAACSPCARLRPIRGAAFPLLPLCLLCISVAVLTSSFRGCCEHIGDAERNGVCSLAIRPVNSGIRVAGPCIELLFRAPLFAYV